MKIGRVERLHDPRSGKLPWAKATGTPGTLSRKAGHYLLQFDYGANLGKVLDGGSAYPSEEILAHVVCNLRNYHGQSADQTVTLIQGLFNPEAQIYWSAEAIRLTWERVEGFTPSLGLLDEMAVAERRAAFMENEVVDLIAWTNPGGRVSGDDLRAVFRDWNPGLDFTDVEFGLAVAVVTGMKSKPSHGVRYWNGFHLPSLEGLIPVEKEGEAA